MKKITNTPIRRNIVANFFGIGVKLFNQLLLVPFYISFWNIDLYGDWIVISAISSFFSMSDIGLNSVTSNQFTISYAGDRSQCRDLLTNNYVIVILVATISLLGSVGYVSFFDITKNLGLNELGRWDASYIFVMLIVKVFLSMGGSIRNAIYRANSKTDRGVYVSNIGIMAESVLILVSLVLRLNMCVMVTLYILPQLFLAIFRVFDTQRMYKYHFSLSNINTSILKSIFIPSLTFMGFPLGNAIVYQGFTLVVNRFLGAEAVVSFNTTRTMCNFMRQLLITTQQAVWPEYSRAYGLGDIVRMRQLHRKAFSISTIGGVALSVCLLIFGPFVYGIWTQGMIPFDYPLVIAFLVVLLADNTWNTSSVCLIATNKHSIIGIGYTITALLSISVAIFIMQTTQSLPLVEYSQLLIHIPLSIYSINAGLKLTQDKWLSFFNIFAIFKKNS